MQAGGSGFVSTSGSIRLSVDSTDGFHNPFGSVSVREYPCGGQEQNDGGALRENTIFHVLTRRMGRIMKKTLLLASLLFISGQASALNVTLTTKIEGGGKPIVSGTTNLPDGIELMITISRKESNYRAQDKVKVKDGAFQSVQFTQKGTPFNPGKYSVEVMMPVAGVQPPASWPIIGNEGSKLEGPLVKNDSFGGKTVVFKTSMVIGTGQASPDQDKKAREQDSKDKHKWWLKSCTDICKVSQGIARKGGEAFDWDRCYHECVVDEPSKK